MPSSHQPAAWTTAATERTVPEEPTADSQPAPARKRRLTGSSSTSAAVSARRQCFSFTRPSGKWRRLVPTQPM